MCNAPAKPRSLRVSAFLLVCTGLLLLNARPAGAQAEAEPPNVVLLFADDLGYGDLSSYGHPLIQTPHLDQMAREGMRLTSFYAAASVCTPSRAALLTGRYPIRSGMSEVLYPNAEEGLPPSEVTLAEALKDEGYRTMAVGKWHLGDRERYLPTEHGFDAYYGLPYSNDMIPPWVDTDVPLRMYRGSEPIPGEVDQDSLTVKYTAEAVDFIRSGSEPFFLYLPYSMPHLPIYTTERFEGTSRGGLYGDVIEAIDWSVGQVLETLEAEGVSENTIVIFTSDNGPWSNMPDRMVQGGVQRWHAGTAGPLRGAKVTTWEGGMRVPGIVRWPREIPAGQTSPEPATTMDLYTTLIEAGGGTVPQDRPVDGNNLLPFLKGETAASPTETFYYYWYGDLHAVREGPWKFFRDTDETSQALYHLERDPAEQIDVSGDHPDLVERLRGKLEEQAAATGAEANEAAAEKKE